MDPAQARAAVIELLAVVMDIEPATVDIHARLEADLGADSLAVVEVVFGLEKRYGIRLPDDVVRELRTVSDLIAATAG